MNDAKFQARLKKQQERSYRKFYKKIGVLGAPQEEINRRIIETAPTFRYEYDIVLSEEQKKDPKFMLALMKSDSRFIGREIFAKELEKNVDFMIDYLKLVFAKRSKYISVSKFSDFDYYYEIQYKTELKNAPGFWIKFAEAFPNCNICAVLDRENERNIGRSTTKKFEVNDFPKHILVSQARKFGKEMFKYVPEDNQYYDELLATSVECDGFKTLSCLKKDKILENRNLIVLAERVSGIDGLKYFFNSVISSRREHSYMCHGEPHYDCYNDVSYFPIMKAIVEDDALFEQMTSPKEELDILRESVREEVDEFYQSIKPLEKQDPVGFSPKIADGEKSRKTTDGK